MLRQFQIRVNHQNATVTYLENQCLLLDFEIKNKTDARKNFDVFKQELQKNSIQFVDAWDALTERGQKIKRILFTMSNIKPLFAALDKAGCFAMPEVCNCHDSLSSEEQQKRINWYRSMMVKNGILESLDKNPQQSATIPKDLYHRLHQRTHKNKKQFHPKLQHFFNSFCSLFHLKHETSKTTVEKETFTARKTI